MNDPAWQDATWAGNRLQQDRDFQALSFQNKLRALESMAEVALALGVKPAASGSSSTTGNEIPR